MFNLFSLHTFMQMREIAFNSEGVHLLDGDLTFSFKGAGFYVEASRIADTPIAAAVIAPGMMMRVGINDLRVSSDYSHSDTLRETARQMGVKALGDLVSCSGCSAAKGRRMAVPWTTGCRSTRLLERGFVDLSGKLVCRRGGVTDNIRGRLVADGVVVFPDAEVRRSGGF